MNVWLPPSHLYRGLSEARTAVSDYDPRLDFGMNEETGQWCVFFNHGAIEAASEHPLPILGFDHIPSRDEVQKRLYNSDALRRGEEIREQINRHNREIERKFEDKASEGSEAAAEGFDWLLRQDDKAPHSKHFFITRGE
jgi:hypothetical protein